MCATSDRPTSSAPLSPPDAPCAPLSLLGAELCPHSLSALPLSTAYGASGTGRARQAVGALREVTPPQNPSGAPASNTGATDSKNPGNTRKLRGARARGAGFLGTTVKCSSAVFSTDAKTHSGLGASSVKQRTLRPAVSACDSSPLTVPADCLRQDQSRASDRGAITRQAHSPGLVTCAITAESSWGTLSKRS